MRFKCGLTDEEVWANRDRANQRIVKLKNWHRWFAWRPITIERGRCIWLEWVERQYRDAWFYSSEEVPRVRRFDPIYREIPREVT